MSFTSQPADTRFKPKEHRLLESQLGKKPTMNPKVQAAGVAGALSILLVYILGLFGLGVPAEVASSLTAIIAWAAGYIKSE